MSSYRREWVLTVRVVTGRMMGIYGDDDREQLEGIKEILARAMEKDSPILTVQILDWKKVP